jgi:hypothetical protein
MQILTATKMTAVRQCMGNYQVFLVANARARWPDAQLNIKWMARGIPVYAEIWRSMWVAQCPDCPEAIIVEPGEPFWCPNCCNAANGGYARPLIFPDNRTAIEELLLARPNPETRNWLEHETLDMLRAENLEHGIGEV